MPRSPATLVINATDKPQTLGDDPEMTSTGPAQLCSHRKLPHEIYDQNLRCRMCPNKRKASLPASLVPIRPRQSNDSPTTQSPLPTETAVPTSKEDEEHDSGNLAQFLNHNNLRDAVLGHHSRAQFIGSELSNCNYLVRQSSSEMGQDKIFHFNNGQLDPKGIWSQVQGVPSEALKRPDKKLEETLIRAYFDLVNRGWPIVDEELFMTQYHRQDPKDMMSLALLNAVLLVGAHAVASQDESMVSLLPVFFQRAKTLVESRVGQDRLSYIQAALLMTWHSDVNAWHWIGIATRTAMALGVHRDCNHSKMLPVYKRTFTRLWWVLFQFDTIASASAGRPQVINLTDSDVPDLQYSHFEGIPGAEIDFVIYQTELCKIISQTIRDGFSPRVSMETRFQVIRRTNESLGEFMLQIPTSIQLKLSNLNTWQSVLHLTYYNFVLLLHRPTPNASIEDQSLEAGDNAILCREATVAIGFIFEALFSQKTTSTLWFYSNHALFTAIIYILNQINSSTPLLAAKSRHTLDTFLTSLRELAKYWTYAKGLLQLFEQRVSKLKEGDLSRTDAPSARPQYGTPEQHGSQIIDPQLDSITVASSHQHMNEGSSEWNEGDSQALANSGAGSSHFDPNNGEMATSFDTSGGFSGASQDPLLDDLLLLDDSVFDFLLYEGIN
ncbi:hypothetical protein FSARC_12636 [Fusarium sarcochroum]|uniref:Xylanolytic transcriptional activator regulatory domain-containing protein n=1 Tax=Fusarium sarcochroum TaxID=1208366 RepID=A0A8H4WWJ7_9HYPO|nr:hypothetical protein FSARC_12636 [Fusarium sarcochroum]